MMTKYDILPLDAWLPSPVLPLVISGPCSAESREQVLATARSLARIPQVKVFRAGIWKPRTRPSKFEGVGARGLSWLQEVKSETGLLTTVEVATPQHIEQALKHKVDILWIGARTVVNPFSVQELAEVLEGVDIPVMVKNPINPDLKLWIGAIERFHSAGIRKLIAVHRGFYYYKHSIYRNQPMWEIPIDLQRMIPGLPILCDPSHISGKRELIQGISQKALDLGMAGLMIETHVNPDDAFTDADQQITPDALAGMLQDLVVRKFTGDVEFEGHLGKLRREIDKMDAELIDILSRRMKIVEEIGEYKKLNNITILQIRRWSEIIYDRLNLGEKVGLHKDFLLKLLQLVHKESIRKQEEIMGVNEDDDLS